MEKIDIKNKQMFRSKLQMVIYLILFVIIIYMFIYLGTIEYKKEIPDNERFADSFKMVELDNVFKYVNASEVRSIAGGVKGIVLFGTSNNEWVNYYASMVNKVAKEVGIEEVYYYDFIKNRVDNNGTYNDIVEKLRDYVTYNDLGNADIYAPSLLVVSNDHVLWFDSETSFVKGNILPSDYWTNIKKLQKEDEMRNVFRRYIESSR